MPFIWDYDINELKKTEAGRIKILERMINYGIYLKDKQKLDLKKVKKYWSKLDLEPRRRRFLKSLICQS